MLRLTDPDDEDIELALCVNAGELLDPRVAFQLALGNVEPFTLKKLDDWDPDRRDISLESDIKTSSWQEKSIANHPSIWSADFAQYLSESRPWVKKVKKVEPIIAAPQTRARKKVVTLVTKYVPETQDESLSIETLSSMYCKEPANKKPKIDTENDTQYIETFTQDEHNVATTENEITKDLSQNKSPILEYKQRSFKKYLEKSGSSVLKKLSRFPRTIMDGKLIESKFFNENNNSGNIGDNSVTIEESPEKADKKSVFRELEIDTRCPEDGSFENSQKENCLSPTKSETSPILISTPKIRNPFKLRPVQCFENDSVLEESQKNSLSPKMAQQSPILDKKSPILNNSTNNRNPFKLKSAQYLESDFVVDVSQGENSSSPKMDQSSPVMDHNSPKMDQKSQILEKINVFMSKESQSSYDTGFSESVIENSCPYEDMVIPVDPEVTKSLYFSESQSPPKVSSQPCLDKFRQVAKKTTCKVPGLRKTASLPSNQPTLLSKFGFQKRTVLKK